MFPHMRTPAVVLVLVMGLGACSNSAAPHGANLLTLTSAEDGACGRTENQLRCWGSLWSLPGVSYSRVPTEPGPPVSGLVLVRSAPFDRGGCGLDASDALFCWGLNGSAYAAVAPALRFTDVTVGQGFQCALATSGTIYCWGVGWGTGISAQDTAIKECGRSPDTYPCVPEPTPIASPDKFKALASGWFHTCAVAQSGQGFCWGGGALGAGPDLQDSQTPVPVASQDRFTSISSGPEGSCAINGAGQPLCWGFSNGGMLGSSEPYLAEPTPVELASGVVMKSVSLGYSHTCTLDTSGAAWCWGTGGLGSGSTSSVTPVQVLGGLRYSTLAAGNGFTCGISGAGAWCWGINNYGQLGNGGSTDSPIPVRVANQDQFDD